MCQVFGSALGRKALLLFAVASTLSGQIIINTVAGNHTAGYSGDGGPAISAQMSSNVFGLASDSAGNLSFGDYSNCRIRKVNTSDAAGDLYIVNAGTNQLFRVASNGTATVIAGTGVARNTGDGGPATAVALDAGGSIYLADRPNNSDTKSFSPPFDCLR